MDIDELRDLLRKDAVTVTFEKKNGELRTMQCTLISDYLPETSGDNRAISNEDLVTVYDLDKGAWRSFRFSSVKSIETDYFNYVVESD